MSGKQQRVRKVQRIPGVLAGVLAGNVALAHTGAGSADPAHGGLAGLAHLLAQHAFWPLAALAVVGWFLVRSRRKSSP